MKTVSKHGKWKIAVVMIILCLIITIFGRCVMTSDYCNCVIVSDESFFTGKWLKYSEADFHSRILKTECEKMDREIDGGNGAKAGRVRWADCMQGPDCDEAGYF